MTTRDNDYYYSTHISWKAHRGLSYYLTKCAATESGGIGGGSSATATGASRPLSCVGMLACGDGCSVVVSSSVVVVGGGGGSLHLIDLTGSHRVRAHAIGDAMRASKLHRRITNYDRAGDRAITSYSYY